MGSYFKPMRRKIGVVTLLMACVFAGLWIRGELIYDEFSSCSWVSSSWGLIFDNGQRTIQRFGSPPENYGGNSMRVMIEGEDYVSEIAEIPHWIVVIPLTLLSAWLMLSTPRVAKSATISEK